MSLLQRLYLTIIISLFLPSILSAQFVYPLIGSKLTSGFGKRKHPILKVVKHHNGVDLSAPYDSLVRAINSGKVVFADAYKGYGNLIVILRNDGKTIHYGHLKDIKVNIGDNIKAGSVIGSVGSTGLSTGPHLHLEIRINGIPLNPLKEFPFLNEKAKG